MYQCQTCGTAYDNNIGECPMCTTGDYSDHFKSEGLIEISVNELMMNEHSFQKCSRCDAYIKMNTKVATAFHLCPRCDTSLTTVGMPAYRNNPQS